MPVAEISFSNRPFGTHPSDLWDLTTRKLALSNAKAVVADSQSFLDFSGIEDEEHSCTVVQRWNREDCIARKENDLLVDLPTRADLLPVDVPDFG
jgi:hypothetical protein